MAKFIVEPHFRLQEWVAEEKGYFRAEGLDYEFDPEGFAGGSVYAPMASVEPSAAAPMAVRSGAFEDFDGGGPCAGWSRSRRPCARRFRCTRWSRSTPSAPGSTPAQ